jgi:hypothetical protein
MAYTTVSVPSPFSQPSWFTPDGRLISSLIAIVEKLEKKIHPTDAGDDVMLEREPRVGPLTIDEVLDGITRRSRS